MTAVDRGAVTDRWQARGFSCDLWIDPPGQVWADFVHTTEELVMVVEGEVEFEIENRVHRPGVGEELLIPAGANHTVRNVGKTPTRWLYGYKKMSTTLYTIGHSNHDMEHFVDLLSTHRIRALVDVRSRPYSKYVPHFQKNRLRQLLRREGFEYHFLGEELGGLLGAKFRNSQGKPDYDRRAIDPDFRAGLDRLIAIGESSPAAIMCAEEDPRRCHRRMLITPGLRERDVVVLHVRDDGRVQSDAEFEERTPQMSLSF